MPNDLEQYRNDFRNTKLHLQINFSLWSTLSLLKLPIKGPFIFYEVGGAGGIWGGINQKKSALKGGSSKKIREKGGHVKYYLYWRGVVGKKLVTGGGVMQLPNDTSKSSTSPPTS